MSRSEGPIWMPATERARDSQLYAFLRQVMASHPQIAGYDDLYGWSLEEPDSFWGSVAEFTGVTFHQRAAGVLAQQGDLRSAQWFSGATLNFAENLLEGFAAEHIALIFRDERGRRRELTRAELRQQVADVAAAMRQVGVRPGDRVAALLPNCPETVVVMLAAASIGAVFSSCSPDFGAPGILERFSQIDPCLLFVCDGYNYGGRLVAMAEKNAQVVAGLSASVQVVQVSFAGSGFAVSDVAPLDEGQAYRRYADFRVPGSAPEYTELPFAHPLYILFSSGTTGRPKCIVHGAGGTLVQHKKELQLHTDLGPADTLFYFTTCGWMMWNWLVSGLSVGARLVLYDGSPLHPAADSLLLMAAEEGVTVFGASPRYLAALQNAGVTQPPAVTRLRTVLSTGAPLPPAAYDYVQQLLGEEAQLCSISGGTDLISCFALGNPLLPVYRGELQCRGLGMAVDVFDAEGRSLGGTGELGELVCTRAFPSMPLGFWNDPDGARYSAAYFKRFPGVWTHGDLARLTEHGGLEIEGRSDAVLNPGGVRMGSAEVTGPALQLPEVEDAVAVARRVDSDEQIVLFVVTAGDNALDEELRERIRAVIRRLSSPRHVPAHILAVPEIPRTLSGKVVELAIRAVMEGRRVDNLGAIANPAALDHFRDRL